jgi:hypothetical protein
VIRGGACVSRAFAAGLVTARFAWAFASGPGKSASAAIITATGTTAERRDVAPERANLCGRIIR